MTGPLEHINQAVGLFFYLLALCGISVLLCHLLRRLLDQLGKPLWPALIGSLVAGAGAALNVLALMLVTLVQLGLGFEEPLSAAGTLLVLLGLGALIGLLLRRDYRRLF